VRLVPLHPTARLTISTLKISQINPGGKEEDRVRTKCHAVTCSRKVNTVGRSHQRYLYSLEARVDRVEQDQ
jgi:hypothetical protein